MAPEAVSSPLWSICSPSAAATGLLILAKIASRTDQPVMTAWYRSTISSAGPAGNGVLGRVADLVKMGADVLHRQGRVVVALGPADEEPGDLAAADRVDLAGDRAVRVGEIRHHRSHQGRVESIEERPHEFLGLLGLLTSAALPIE